MLQAGRHFLRPISKVLTFFFGLGSALNVFFNFRSPAPTVVPLVLLLLSHPFGRLLAFILPNATYRLPLPSLSSTLLTKRTPLWFSDAVLPFTHSRAIEFSFNPGPWNIKEHSLVYIMANVSVGSPYALNAIVVSEVFYDLALGYWFSLMLVLATQLTGFGLAGLCRRFLVWPASMVWPQNLVACALLNTLHTNEDDDTIGMFGTRSQLGKGGMSRHKFFVIMTIASFFWFFIPGMAFRFCHCIIF